MGQIDGNGGSRRRAGVLVLCLLLVATPVALATALLIQFVPHATGSTASRAQLAASTSSDGVDRKAVAEWAVANANWGGWNPMFVGTDCTDFVSRALQYGGGLSEVAPPAARQVNHDNDRAYWYIDEKVEVSPRILGSTVRHTYSKTWSEAPWSFRYQLSRGGTVVPRSAVKVGDIAYVNLRGSSASKIDHAGVVTRVTGTNVYVAQQSGPNPFLPVYDDASGSSWQSVYPKMTPFFVDPSAER